MKKIDLHIHTKKSISDADFDFDLTKLQEYVTELQIDAIAITNHNLFDQEQYKVICNYLRDVIVFPGIEVNLEHGHILVITDNTHVSDLIIKANQVQKIIQEPTMYLSIAQFKDIFHDFTNYILIPHYDKKPALAKQFINQLPDITAGEVNSPKKFISCRKNQNDLVPLYFSDCRLTSEIPSFPNRQTYVDVGEITLFALKESFKDRTKVALDGIHNDLIDVLDGEIKISSGLSVVLGRRSSGKSYTLDRIFHHFGTNNVKYIRQFSLVRDTDNENRNIFDSMLAQKRNSLFEDYINEFKAVVDDIIPIDDVQQDDRKISEYLESLLAFANAENLKDIYSNCSLYLDYKFDIKKPDSLESLMDNVLELLANTEYKKLIDTYLDREKLITLLEVLYQEYEKIKEQIAIKEWANELMGEINKQLQFNSSSPRISALNFYDIAMNHLKRQKFEQVCNVIRKEEVISVKDIGKFKIRAKTRCFKNATEMKLIIGKQMSLVEAYKKYDKPIEYIKILKQIENLNNADIYKLFITIDYSILNEYELEVSGGEKAEYNLLNAIQDARNYDMLLIDEPESSFDNIFLNTEVNVVLKELAKEMPVVIVTHNNTIGESIHPDFLIYTLKQIIDKKPVFKIFYGYPADKCLESKCGDKYENFTIQLDSLEAGHEAYLQRRKTYENLKN